MTSTDVLAPAPEVIPRKRGKDKSKCVGLGNTLLRVVPPFTVPLGLLSREAMLTANWVGMQQEGAFKGGGVFGFCFFVCLFVGRSCWKEKKVTINHESGRR
jgi:hypothetical protein